MSFSKKAIPSLHIGLLGFGTVGVGIFKILQKNQQTIFLRTGQSISIYSILVRDIHKKRDVDVAPVLFTTSAMDILQNPDIQIVVEALGGEKPALDYITLALKNHKYVVTANKEVMAKHRVYLTKLAQENEVDIYYEASVGGGIPIIQALKSGFAANQIQSIYGILNGTTNYILTKIEEDQLEFQKALAQAQKLGFAEADPAMDISGLDAAYKLAILASIAFKVNVTLSDIEYEGIQSISLRDIIYADELGYRIKLLAIAKRVASTKLFLTVSPVMITKTHPLAAVRNEFNAIYVTGDAIEGAMLYGKGAGSLPTGSAVVSDIMDISFSYPHNSRRNLETDFPDVTLSSRSEQSSTFYLRLFVEDHFGVLEKIAGVFGKNRVSILKVIQKDILHKKAEIVIVTHIVKEQHILSAVQDLKALSCIHQVCCCIRIGLL